MPDFLEKAKQAAETKNPDQLDSPARSMQVAIEDASARLREMPAENPAVKSMVARLAAVSEKFETAVIGVQGADAFQHLSEEWAIYVKQTEGWGSDSIGVTLADFIAAANENASSLGSAKAVDLVRISNSWLDKNFGAAYGQARDRKKDNYRVFLRDPKTKALVDSIVQERDAAEAKLIKAAIALLDEAEKATLTPEAKARFAKLSDRTLPESLKDSPTFGAAIIRIKALAQ